jgi:hypothetical protein
MGSITRTALVLACSAVLAGGMALPASAADVPDTAGTEATVSVTGGVLAMSAPEDAAFASVVPGGTASFNLSGINVTDTRAGVIGWSTTAALTNFVGQTDNAHIIAATNAAYNPALTASTGNATFTEATGAVGVSTATVVEAATDVTGNNTATWDAGLALAVPSNALADDYIATLTHSLL